MSLLARDLFVFIIHSIFWIYFGNSQPPISLNAAASLFKDTLAITLTWLFHQISFKGHLMWILLPWRHLLLLSLVVLVLVVVVVVVVVVMVVVVIVQVTAVVVVKSWTELVNSKLGKHILGARAVKYILGARAGKHKLGARAGIYKFGTTAGKHKLGARADKYKFGARARAGGQAKGQGPGNTNTRILNIRVFHQILATKALINLHQNVKFYFRMIRSLSWLIGL